MPEAAVKGTPESGSVTVSQREGGGVPERQSVAAWETGSAAAAPQNACKSEGAVELLWAAAPEELVLHEAEVHIFAARLDIPPAGDSGRSILSRDEKARAGRFHFEMDRSRYVVARTLLRTILGRYLNVLPQKLVFSYRAAGKPVLGPPFTRTDLKFNLAHSEDLGLLAVTTATDVGVDVERVRPVPDAAELVLRFFSAREAELFAEVPPELQPPAFFNLWTRKEAWLKATGEGIAHSLKRVEVSFLSHEPTRLLAVPPDALPAARWTLRELHPAPGFAAAVAVASFPIQLRCFSWPTLDEV